MMEDLHARSVFSFQDLRGRLFACSAGDEQAGKAMVVAG
jgi:hypothetical protein